MVDANTKGGEADTAYHAIDKLAGAPIDRSSHLSCAFDTVMRHWPAIEQRVCRINEAGMIFQY